MEKITKYAIIFVIDFWWLPIVLFFIFRGVIRSIKQKAKKAHEERITSYINTNSKLLKELKVLNSSQSFLELKQMYSFDYRLNTKREFDTFDPYDAFCNLCYGKRSEFREIIKDVRENRKRLEAYEEKFSQITQRLGSDGLGGEYSEAELAALSGNKLTPVINPHISLLYEYRTPKGQKVYHRSAEYEIDEIEKAIKQKRKIYSAEAKYRATVQHERSLMTEKLRYQVLQRDGFRCCICGASSQDGVKLHVDHIKPVSKGGKTELNNLRTLCDRCNLGKGSSYFEGGIN